MAKRAIKPFFLVFGSLLMVFAMRSRAKLFGLTESHKKQKPCLVGRASDERGGNGVGALRECVFVLFLRLCFNPQW